MIDPTTLFVLLAVACAAFLRGLAGFGFALAAVPLLSLVLPPVQAVTLAILLQLPVGVQDLLQQRGRAHRPSLIRLTLGAALGTPLGLAALTLLRPDVARVLIAALVLAGLGLILRHRPAGATLRPGLAWGAGLVAGVFSGLAAMPGPPAVAYYLGAGTTPAQTRASLLLFFFAAALMAVPGLWLAGAIDGAALGLGAVSLVPMGLGTWAGSRAFTRLDPAQYRRIAVAIMALSALLAGGRGLAAWL